MQIFTTLVSRADVNEGVLSGYAAVFDQPTTRQAQFAGSETIARSAFDAVLGDDVVALVDHDPSKLLARTSSQTLRLSVDDHGLAFQLDLPDTSLGRDVAELVRRGDLTGMSFSAAVGELERVKGGVVHRSFGRLLDVSVVTRPAYLGTSVVARNAVEQTLRGQLAMIRHAARKG